MAHFNPEWWLSLDRNEWLSLVRNIQRRTKFRNVSVAEDDYNTVIWEYFKGLEIWIRKKLKYPLWWHKISFKLRNSKNEGSNKILK